MTSTVRPGRGDIDLDGVDGSTDDGGEVEVDDDAGQQHDGGDPDASTLDEMDAGEASVDEDAGEVVDTPEEDAGEEAPESCADLTCDNGGSCKPQDGKAVCDCPPAWTGDTCADDVDECAAGTDSCNVAAFPCLNVPGGFTCVGAMADWPIAKRTFDNVSFADEGLIVDADAGTILDDVTGLMWQRDLSPASDYPTAEADCAALELAGFDDWRLPAMIELQTWFTTPSLPRFPLGLFATAPNDVWSSTPPSVSGQHISAQMGNAYQYTRLDTDMLPAHLCVRTAEAKAQGTPAERYDLETAGVAYDQRTDLAWQRSDDGGAFTYEEAETYCSELALAGLAWRLPTFLELVSLLDWSRGLPGISDSVFDGPYQRHFWTQTLRVSTQTHMQVDSNHLRWSWARGDDTGPIYNAVDSAPTYVRCVHEGTP